MNKTALLTGLTALGACNEGYSAVHYSTCEDARCAWETHSDALHVAWLLNILGGRRVSVRRDTALACLKLALPHAGDMELHVRRAIAFLGENGTEKEIDSRVWDVADQIVRDAVADASRRDNEWMAIETVDLIREAALCYEKRNYGPDAVGYMRGYLHRHSGLSVSEAEAATLAAVREALPFEAVYPLFVEELERRGIKQ